jgi:integrase
MRVVCPISGQKEYRGMSELIDVHLAHIRAEGAATTTIDARRKVLGFADHAMPYGIDTATTAELADWLGTPGWSGWTRVTYYSHLKALYDWACGGDDPWLDWSPMDGIRRPRNPTVVPHPVTDDELAAALARSDDWWRLVITLAAWAGLRAAEICRLRREDVSVERVRIWRGKGGRDAEVPTHPAVWTVVEGRPPGLLVRARRAVGPMRSGTLSAEARHHFDAIGQPAVHLHRFRHWYGTAMLRAGTDVRVIQTLMRHSSLATTAGYLQVGDEQREMAVRTLPAPRSPQQDAA